MRLLTALLASPLLALMACRSAPEPSLDSPPDSPLQSQPVSRPDLSTMTRLPDGSYIPNLNGVKVPMVWSGKNFSPIKGINVTDAGVEWWVHENGMQSTTFLLKNKRDGVEVSQPTLLIAHPMPQADQEKKKKKKKKKQP